MTPLDRALVGGARRARALLATLAVGVALTGPAHANPGAAAQVEIDHLLDFVGASQCAFIRNGTAHPADAAKTHLVEKFQFAKGRIATAEEFIRYVATSSSITGEVYRVRCGAAEVPAGAWLGDELSRFRLTLAATPAR